MILIIWIFFILVFLAIFLSFKLFYMKKVRVSDDILEENLKTADQYEIALLSGGKRLVIQLAFYHFLKAGYFERAESKEPSSAKYLFRAIPSKDTTQLTDLEKEILGKFEASISLFSVFAKELSSLEKFNSKLGKLNLFYSAKSTIGVLWRIYTIFAWVFSVIYLVYGAPHSFWVKIFLIIVINIWVCFIVWNQILGRKDYFDGKLLTCSGKKYIKLFEEKYFPLPNFKSEELYKEAEEFNPCST